MGVPDGSAPAAMPTADVETADALRLETVREDGAMLEALARPEQVFLRGPAADRQIAARCGGRGETVTYIRRAGKGCQNLCK